MSAASTGMGSCGPGLGSGTCTPRKFSEKIALHTQRQAEDNAAFQEVMMDITSTRLQAQKVRLARSQAPYYGGSLPNVNQIGQNNSEFQGPFHPHLESGPSTRHHGLVERGRKFTSPVRPYRKQTEGSPLSSAYLSPPLEPNWRRHWSTNMRMDKSQSLRLPISALNRTNSDSALHISVNDPHVGHHYGSIPQNRRSVFSSPVPPIEENVLDEVKLPKPWDTKKLPMLSSRPKSCEVPGINIFPSPDQQCAGPLLPSALNTGGSLPDLTSLHFPSPLPTPLDADEPIFPSLRGGSSTGNLAATLTQLGIDAGNAFRSPGLSCSLQGAFSSSLLQSSLSHPNIQSSLNNSSFPGSLSSPPMHSSLSNPSLKSSLDSSPSLPSSLSNQSLPSSPSNSSLSGQPLQSTASNPGFGSGSASSSAYPPPVAGHPQSALATSPRRRHQLSALILTGGGESRWHHAKPFSPTLALSSITQGVPLDISEQPLEQMQAFYPYSQSHTGPTASQPSGQQSMQHSGEPPQQHRQQEQFQPQQHRQQEQFQSQQQFQQQQQHQTQLQFQTQQHRQQEQFQPQQQQQQEQFQPQQQQQQEQFQPQQQQQQEQFQPQQHRQQEQFQPQQQQQQQEQFQPQQHRQQEQFQPQQHRQQEQFQPQQQQQQQEQFQPQQHRQQEQFQPQQHRQQEQFQPQQHRQQEQFQTQQQQQQEQFQPQQHRQQEQFQPQQHRQQEQFQPQQQQQQEQFQPQQHRQQEQFQPQQQQQQEQFQPQQHRQQEQFQTQQQQQQQQQQQPEKQHKHQLRKQHKEKQKQQLQQQQSQCTRMQFQDLLQHTENVQDLLNSQDSQGLPSQLQMSGSVQDHLRAQTQITLDERAKTDQIQQASITPQISHSLEMDLDLYSDSSLISTLLDDPYMNFQFEARQDPAFSQQLGQFDMEAQGSGSGAPGSQGEASYRTYGGGGCHDTSNVLLSEHSTAGLSKEIASALSDVPGFEMDPFSLGNPLRVDPLALVGLRMLGDGDFVLPDPKAEESFRSDHLL